MQKKSIVAALAVLSLIVAVIVVFVAPAIIPNTIAIQFYDENGNPVGAPQKAGLLNGAPVLVDGIAVTSFDITVEWSTNDPQVQFVEWGLNIKVWYYTSDVYPPEEHVVFDDACWADTGNGASGSKRSAQYVIDAYAETGVPRDTAFYIKFYGFLKFGALVVGWLHEMELSPVQISCFHSEYEYTATLDVGW